MSDVEDPADAPLTSGPEAEGGPDSSEPESPTEPESGESTRPIVEVPPRPLERRPPGTVPAYQVAARMLLQGVLSGFAGAVPLTAFLLVGMALDGIGLPDPLSMLGGYLFFAAMIAAWGAALTAVEEFARRADRSVQRMLAASLGFPLFAVVAAAWIGGVIADGPLGGMRMVREIVTDLLGEFRRHPVGSSAITGALLIPFLGLLLVRRREGEVEGPFLVSRYYLASGGLGLACAGCILVANLFWRTRTDFGPVVLGFTAMCVLVMAVAWGLARGRAISDHYSRRYERWADAD